jgi:profilin
MSWNDYITNKLINVVDSNNHKLLNVLSNAMIVGNTDGAVWATTQGFALKNEPVDVTLPDGTVKKETVNELVNIADAFCNNGDTKKLGGIRINKEKFYMTNFDNERKVMYLKKSGGGGCIALTGKAYIIGVFETSKKMKRDDVEENQNPGYCNKVVEELQTYFLSIGY